MYPFWIFCGKVRRPGRVSVATDSSLGLLILSTKPLASPSVPGHGSCPAPLCHVAAQALVAKSYAMLGAGVTVGPPGVTVGPPGVTVGPPETFISTHHGLFAWVPMPKRAPLAFLNIQ